jgi:hypothetical protein
MGFFSKLFGKKDKAEPVTAPEPPSMPADEQAEAPGHEHDHDHDHDHEGHDHQQ